MKESGGMGGRAMRLMSGRGVGESGSGRHSYGGGVISEVGWLSLCGAPPRGFCIALHNLVVAAHTRDTRGSIYIYILMASAWKKIEPGPACSAC